MSAVSAGQGVSRAREPRRNCHRTLRIFNFYCAALILLGAMVVQFNSRTEDRSWFKPLLIVKLDIVHTMI